MSVKSKKVLASSNLIAKSNITHLRRVPVELDGAVGLEAGGDESAIGLEDGDRARAVICEGKI